ncbi:MAG: DUF6273 domain-containing protein, partial [Roseburia sp.]
KHDLTIVLAEGSTNTVENDSGAAIVGDFGYASGPSLIIEGSGTLNVSGSTSGIWAWQNVTIQGDAKVNARGRTKCGICNNISDGAITIKDNAVVEATGGTYGIGYDNSRYNVPVIQGGTVKVTGGTAAVMEAPDLSSYTGGYKVTVGDAAPDTVWDNTTPLSTYKYLKIEPINHDHSWSSTWNYDETYHWHECENTGCYVTDTSSKESYGEHVFTDDTDTDCNICGYIRTVTPPSDPGKVETPDAPVNGKGLGISIIAEPTAPQDATDEWTGSFVYFGTYNGTPVKYRVLDRNTTDFGNSTMLLDCDSVLWQDSDLNNPLEDSSNVWTNSYVKKYLNSEETYSDTGFLSCSFTGTEQSAIAASVKASASESDGNGNAYFKYTALSGEKIFLLDVQEATRETYGYSNTDNLSTNRKKTGGIAYWWLRSVYSDSAGISYAGFVNSGGDIAMCSPHLGYSYVGVSPALNVNLSSVIFSSVLSGNAGQPGAEYKLTLNDSNMIIVTNGTLTRNSSNQAIVSYTLTGSNAANATQVSLMVLDGEYTEGNTNGAKLIAYEKIGDVDNSNTTGTGIFTLTDDMKNDSYYYYIVAEDVNSGKATDYASAPVPLTVSEATVQKYTVTVNNGSGSGEYAENDSVTITADAAPDGQQFKNWVGLEDLSITSGNAASESVTFMMPAKEVTVTANYEAVPVKPGETAPSITAQPGNVTVKEGETATFTITASGTNLTYQWMINRNDGSGWAEIPNANTASYTTSTVDKSCDSFQYKCVVSNSGGTVESIAVTLNVREAGGSTDNPGDSTDNPGDSTDNPDTPLYEIIEGANSSWTLESDGSLTIRGNGEFAKFSEVKVDDSVLDRSHYSTKEGSTIISLKAAYLNTLTPGTHTCEIVWTDGSASTTFTVSAKAPDNSGNNNNSQKESNSPTDNHTLEIGIRKKDDVPKTGDNISDVWLFVLMIASGTGMIVAGKKRR